MTVSCHSQRVLWSCFYRDPIKETPWAACGDTSCGRSRCDGALPASLKRRSCVTAKTLCVCLGGSDSLGSKREPWSRAKLVRIERDKLSCAKASRRPRARPPRGSAPCGGPWPPLVRFCGPGVLSRFVFGVLGSVSLNSVLKIRVSHLCKTARFIQSDIGIQKN